MRIFLINIIIYFFAIDVFGQDLEIALKYKDSILYKISNKSIFAVDFQNRIFYLTNNEKDLLFDKICDCTRKLPFEHIKLNITLDNIIFIDNIRFVDPYSSAINFFSDKFFHDMLAPDSINFEYIPIYPTLLIGCGKNMPKLIQFKLLYKHGIYDQWFTRKVYNSLVAKKKIHLPLKNNIVKAKKTIW